MNDKPRPCPYCDVTGDEASDMEFLAKIESCNNCRVDIALKGQWTGIGWRALQRRKANREVVQSGGAA